mgnify:CR=1 FL=1
MTEKLVTKMMSLYTNKHNHLIEERNSNDNYRRI